MDSSPGRLLLAGSFGPERSAASKDSDDPRWFEPLHVRDAAAARTRIAEQVASGADIVVAPTWQTHRRALLPVGETRRAREWTAAAADIARQGVEEGLERRALAAQEREVAEADDRSVGKGTGASPQLADSESERGADLGRRDFDPEREAELDRGDDPLPARPHPLVAGVLPLLDEQAEPGSGRLAPTEVAAERDYRDQAGLLSDAEVDLILVEGQRTVAGTRTAIEAAVATGLPAWVAAIPELAPGDDAARSLQRWIDTCVGAGARTLLAPAASTSGAIQAIAVASRWTAASDLDWGSQLDPATELREPAAAWLEAGATILGLADGATTESIASIRAVLDATEQAQRVVTTRERDRWHAFILEAVRMAPGGAALWIDEQPADMHTVLPDGFEWLVVDPHQLPQMPHDHFRSIVDAAGSEDSRHLVPLLEMGGLLTLSVRGAVVDIPGLRLLRLDDSAQPLLMTLRRER